jgi:hypothetical protein
LSLGVGAFSVAQRGAILKELELLRRANPDLEPFFVQYPLEPFFVKNLENIQCDERDVIFISVGYGRSETGTLAMNFGPLSADGGERRLNVLISRAKLRCEVFSSITAEDIDLERGRSRGVAAFKRFLSFAQTGQFEHHEPSGGDPDSVFEEQVAAKLRSRGHDVRAQIGTAGFFVDLAIVDPDKPGRYLLGIECDGAQYHAARSARDRDRLRQSVLEDHDWIIHRIWSTDWYLRPEDELRKVEDAIIAAKSLWRDRDDMRAKPARPAPPPLEAEAQDNEPVSLPDETISVPYKEASFAVDRDVEPHDVPLTQMAGIVTRIVAEEGPIHLDEIVQRVRTLWGLGRAGSRVRGAVVQAIEAARAQGLIVGDAFLVKPGAPIAVRNRADVESSTLRKPESLPPQEIDAAILKLVAANFGAGREGLITGLARAFGFAATSAVLRDLFDARITALIQSSQLHEANGLITAKV